jgi:hypothetical protein
MSVMAISPVPFVNAGSLVNTQLEAQSHLQEDAQKTTAQISSDVSSSGSAVTAVQAFMAFQPDVQPIASLNPPNDTQPPVPVEASTDLSGSTPQWSGAIVDVYA